VLTAAVLTFARLAWLLLAWFPRLLRLALLRFAALLRIVFLISIHFEPLCMGILNLCVWEIGSPVIRGGSSFPELLLNQDLLL